MLSFDDQQVFVDFAQQLDQFGQLATQTNPDMVALRQRFLTHQQQFQQQIMVLQPEHLSAAGAQQLQRCQTEMNRLMRLLGTDVSFLQTARQTITRQQRQAQIRQRIAQLQALCNTLL